MGTRPEAIDLAEDRRRFSAILDELGIAYPAAGTANSFEEALEVARRIGFPLLVRPSYVLGGRGMVIAYDEHYLETLHGRGDPGLTGSPCAARPLPRRCYRGRRGCGV